MVSICRAEDQPPCSETFSKLLGSLEEGRGRKRISVVVVDGEVTVTQTANEAEKCSTPTAKECRIPDMLTCPPAPRKRRVSFSRLPSVRVKEYFVPPNLEAIFVLDKLSSVK